MRLTIILWFVVVFLSGTFVSCKKKGAPVLSYESTLICDGDLINNALGLWKAKLDNEPGIENTIEHSNDFLRQFLGFSRSAGFSEMNSHLAQFAFFYGNGRDGLEINTLFELNRDTSIKQKGEKIISKSLITIKEKKDTVGKVTVDFLLKQFHYKAKSVWLLERVFFKEDYKDPKLMSHPFFLYRYEIDKETGDAFNFIDVGTKYTFTTKEKYSGSFIPKVGFDSMYIKDSMLPVFCKVDSIDLFFTNNALAKRDLILIVK